MTKEELFEVPVNQEIFKACQLVAAFQNCSVVDLINQLLYDSLRYLVDVVPIATEKCTLSFGDDEISMPVVDNRVYSAPPALLQLETLLILTNILSNVSKPLVYYEAMGVLAQYSAGDNPYVDGYNSTLNSRLTGYVLNKLEDSYGPVLP